MHSLIRQILCHIIKVLLGLATKIFSPKISAQFQKQSLSRCLGRINLSLFSNLQNNKLKYIYIHFFVFLKKKCVLVVEYLQDVEKKNERKRKLPRVDPPPAPAPPRPRPSSPHRADIWFTRVGRVGGWALVPTTSSSFSSVPAPSSVEAPVFSWLTVSPLHILWLLFSLSVHFLQDFNPSFVSVLHVSSQVPSHQHWNMRGDYFILNTIPRTPHFLLLLP